MRIASLLLIVSSIAAPAIAQTPDGAAIFKQSCASCHTAAPAEGRTPAESALRALSPDAIVTALTSGLMRLQGAALTEPQRRAVAAYLGRTAPAATVPVTPTAAMCSTVPAVVDAEAGAFWNGWGAGVRNTRFQPAERARLDVSQVPRLKLKWAFGFPNASAARTQPTIAGGRLLTAGDGGEVYSLDPRTGCVHWTFRAQAGVRTAITVAVYAGAGAEGPFAAYFGDTRANLYAVDVITGKPLWTRRLDDHPAAGITGAPTFYRGRLYVGVAGLGEEIQASNLKYACCTFRGSVSAIDSATGAVHWKTYTVADAPAPRGKNSAGVQLYGPSGGAVWNAPTIDAARGVLYVGTGNGYSDPPQPYTDAVLAFDLRTGAVRWAFQATKGDVWILGCPSAPNNNCPTQLGPDYDFGSSPILATIPGGRELIIAGQKSGMVYALDPDKQGAKVWEYRAGKGAMTGGVQWGSAVDAQHVYVAVSDAMVSPAEAGGLHAVRLDTGQRTWLTPPPPPVCGKPGPQCNGAQSAAVTAMTGVIFSGSSDGAMRAFAADSGKVIWEFDTNRDFATVNGVRARGGSIDGPGAVVVNGMVFFNSGASLGGRPGNVLLAFAPE
jgi:polyvinyl alcohol dehydrogenase (cytochrome)